mmetsp:Transcript_16379/g.25946  ORF Transcript_16379/g.25946 Transcript_16379/m.25946 type:complete len:226 (+) Transcript_16379:946-1623(+)
MLVWLSPFLYSRGLSRRMMRGLTIFLRMLGLTISLEIAIPLRTLDSSRKPPGIFSTRMYRLISTTLVFISVMVTLRTAWMAILQMRSPKRRTYLVPKHVRMTLSIAFSSSGSTSVAISSRVSRAVSSALIYDITTVLGCIFSSRKGLATVSISPAKTITDVVPSPTSSSCVRLSSIMLLAAGCETSISRRIAFPSFVRTIPPIGSRIIFNIARGPRVVRTIPATA